MPEPTPGRGLSRSLDDEASRAGVDSFEVTRDTLIEWRNNALESGRFNPEAAALLSHVIWWMSTLHEAVDV